MKIKLNLFLYSLFGFITISVLSFAGFFDFLSKKTGISIYYFLLSFLSVFLYILFLLIDKLILKQIKLMSEILTNNKSEKEGDLTQRLPVKNFNIIGIFSRHFNIFSAKIHNIIAKMKIISTNSGQIGLNLSSSITEMLSSIEEISATVTNINSNEKNLGNVLKSSQGAVNDINNSIGKIAGNILQQSSSLIESSSATKQIITSIKNINAVSESKRQMINSLTLLAKEGEDDVIKTLDYIKEISDSAVLINQLISVIHNISKQTNILAMNAAIEAAHAGEYGKGFGVVADEIRSFAENTGKNVQDITKNIKNIVKKIEEASKFTGKTNKSIQTMTAGIVDVSKSLDEIVSGLNEMATGSEQVILTLTNLNSITTIVQESSEEIVNKSKVIGNLINDAALVSETSINSMDEISNAIKEIVKTTTYINSQGVENSEYIKIMDSEIKELKTINTSALKSSDGQNLIIWNPKLKDIPPRPDNPLSYPEDDDRHWYDYEYSGFGVEKVNMPESLTDGSKGKKVIWVRPGEHPYYSAEEKGMLKISDSFGINLKFLVGNWTESVQENLINQAINENPDLMIVTPINATTSTEWFKKLNKLKIPVVTCTSAPSDEAFKYILSHTGGDSWGQARLLARKFAELMNFDGGYCIVEHNIGSSILYARTYSFLTELKKIAPKMRCLDKQSTNLEYEKTKNTVAGWINKFGKGLKGLVICDSGDALTASMESVLKCRKRRYYQSYRRQL